MKRKRRNIRLAAKIHCLKCDDIVESTSQHDFKACKCGACFVDGGDIYYVRYGGDPTDFTVFDDKGKEYKFNSKTQTGDIEVK